MGNLLLGNNGVNEKREVIATKSWLFFVWSLTLTVRLVLHHSSADRKDKGLLLLELVV